MSNKFRGIIYILSPFIPIIVIGMATLLLFMFWIKIKPEIIAFGDSYQRVKTTIGRSTHELKIILYDAKKHLVDTIESSGIPELIAAYQAAISGLDSLCGPRSPQTGYLPPAWNDYLSPTNGGVIGRRLAAAANPLSRYFRSGPGSPRMDYVVLQRTVDKPDFHQQQFKFVFLQVDGSKITKETKKLETELNNALKKAGKDVEKAWEKAKKDVAETKGLAVTTFSKEIEKIKTEFSEAVAALSRGARQTAKNFGAQMDAMAQTSCEFVTDPMVAIIKPVLQRSIRPFMHLDNAIEDLKKLIALQTTIKEILSDSVKMYANLSQALNLFMAMLKKIVYLLVILLIFTTAHRVTTRTEEIKKGWQLLTS